MMLLNCGTNRYGTNSIVWLASDVKTARSSIIDYIGKPSDVEISSSVLIIAVHEHSQSGSQHNNYYMYMVSRFLYDFQCALSPCTAMSRTMKYDSKEYGQNNACFYHVCGSQGRN